MDHISTDIFDDVNWVKEKEFSDSDFDFGDENEMPDRCFMLCYDIRIASTKGQNWEDMGCWIAREFDMTGTAGH